MFFKPLKCREALKALLSLGFVEEKGTGGSHRQFTGFINEVFRKVTLDCHNGEVSALNVKSMASQAGVSRTIFYKSAKNK